MIEAEKLTKFYGRRGAVRGVTFNIGKGEIVGLLGPNGAGKTTTMRMLTGYLPATSGRAIVAGFNVAEAPMEVRKRLGYLPETVPLYTDMTVTAYLDFTAKIRGVPSKERRNRINEVMELCRIADVRNKVIGKLSRGYKQRVGLAQAIVHNPDVIILDEPTVGLDPRQIIEIRHVIRDLAGDHSMILSTHILPEVSTLCDRVIIINQGRVLVDDSLANLERQGAENERLQLEVRGEADRVLELLQAVAGVVEVTHLNAEAEPAELNRFIVAGEAGSDHREVLANTLIGRGFGLLELKTAIPTLEEIFVRVITNDPVISDDEDESALSDEEMDDEDATRPVRAKNQDDDLDDLEDADDIDDEDEDEDEELEEAEVKPLKATPAFLQTNDDDDLDEPRPANNGKKKK